MPAAWPGAVRGRADLPSARGSAVLGALSAARLRSARRALPKRGAGGGPAVPRALQHAQGDAAGHLRHRGRARLYAARPRTQARRDGGPLHRRVRRRHARRRLRRGRCARAHRGARHPVGGRARGQDACAQRGRGDRPRRMRRRGRQAVDRRAQRGRPTGARRGGRGGRSRRSRARREGVHVPRAACESRVPHASDGGGAARAWREARGHEVASALGPTLLQWHGHLDDGGDRNGRVLLGGTRRLVRALGRQHGRARDTGARGRRRGGLGLVPRAALGRVQGARRGRSEHDLDASSSQGGLGEGRGRPAVLWRGPRESVGARMRPRLAGVPRRGTVHQAAATDVRIRRGGLLG